MASDEMRKKWGTIFMGDREASVEQLNAMREKADHEKLQKEREEDYMERVRARAADRAREILGEAYTERQKVLEEAKGEAAIQKRLALQECAKIKGEGEAIKASAQAELAKAQAELEEALKIKDNAREEGYKEGMANAGIELQEFRAELGQSMAALMRNIERQRKNILESWRNELVELTKAAVSAGTGMVLQKDQEAMLRALVYKSLDLLENRSAISCRVNPRDEETVSELFRAARERFPELRQWTVNGDETIEPGGMVVESGTGSVDLRRSNFQEMVNGILEHLGLPEDNNEEANEREVAQLVEQEVAHIASLTPEPDLVSQGSKQEEQEIPAPEEIAFQAIEPENAEEYIEITEDDEGNNDGSMEEDEPMEAANEESTPDIGPASASGNANMSLAELEEELFPLEDEAGENGQIQPDQSDMKNGSNQPDPAPTEKNEQEEQLDSKIFSEGGFL